MSWRWFLIGCGGLAALGVVLFIVLVIGIAMGEGGDTDRTERVEAEKKPPPKKKAASQNVEAAVGESAKLEDRTLVVNDVQRNFTPENRVGQPKVGNELVRIFVTLTNTSNQPFAYNPNNFKVQYSSGVKRIPHSVPVLPYPVRHGSLAPGGPLEGNMVFEVPQGAGGIRMVYEPYERERLGTVTVML